MRSKLYFIAAVAVLLGAGCGCNQEKCSDEYYDYTPDPPRSYFFFPEGSWWAYENSVTGEVDTLTASASSGYLIYSSDGSGSPTCVEGYSEYQAFIFNDGKYFRVDAITRNSREVELTVNMRDHFITNHWFRWDSFGDNFATKGDFSIVELDTMFNEYLSDTVLSVMLVNSSFTSDTAWFSNRLGLARLSYGDTVLQLKDYRTL